MLIEKRLWDGIRSGRITVLFRQWRQRQASPGGVYRTAAGRIAIDAIDAIPLSRVTHADARRAGFADRDAAVADVLKRGLSDDVPLYRLRIRYLDEPDPRSQLAATALLTDEDIAALDKRLDRLDQASSYGPWTAETFALIEKWPERRAPDLAEMVGRETAPFKLDVRKLKNLGLTLSFPVGYRISPRGEEYLRRSMR